MVQDDGDAWVSLGMGVVVVSGAAQGCKAGNQLKMLPLIFGVFSVKYLGHCWPRCAGARSVRLVYAG